MRKCGTILEQLKVRIQGGDREATINLNPVDLGRLRLHVPPPHAVGHAQPLDSERVSEAGLERPVLGSLLPS